MDKGTTRIDYHINAVREKVYKALIDKEALQIWRVPDSMRSHIHSFDGRIGGFFLISLTYDSQSGKGKSTENTDIYTGRFIEIIPNEKVVEAGEFVTVDSNLKGKMIITITLKDSNSGSYLLALHEGLPRGVSASDNEIGWREALTKLKALVES